MEEEDTEKLQLSSCIQDLRLQRMTSSGFFLWSLSLN